MKIIGLPLTSFFLLIVLPWILVLGQFYYCWRIYKQNRMTGRGE